MISRYYHILSDIEHRHHHLVKTVLLKRVFKFNNSTDNNLSALKYYFLWVESWSKIKEEDNLLKIIMKNIQKILMSLLKNFIFFRNKIFR